MDTVGTINIEVKFNGMRPLTHEFKVLNTKTYANILLVRDLNKIFGTVKFILTIIESKFLNITESDIVITSRKIIRSLRQMDDQ